MDKAKKARPTEVERASRVDLPSELGEQTHACEADAATATGAAVTFALRALVTLGAAVAVLRGLILLGLPLAPFAALLAEAEAFAVLGLVTFEVLGAVFLATVFFAVAVFLAAMVMMYFRSEFNSTLAESVVRQSASASLRGASLGLSRTRVSCVGYNSAQVLDHINRHG